ncbi:hypothetical protein AVEN_115172-1 [Araneus ventricosus]|uniref:Uncharacterized protein n=1 Tax=Araneus ventricosus TaxID=182803 RepID=A0A4Y1ZXJ4_ARAVE|nr:hypothetical protein AVEN_115172-1 [Araneus ventricosus]
MKLHLHEKDYLIVLMNMIGIKKIRAIPYAYKERFSINRWAGLVHDYLIGPSSYLLVTRIGARIPSYCKKPCWPTSLCLFKAKSSTNIMVLMNILTLMSDITWNQTGG